MAYWESKFRVSRFRIEGCALGWRDLGAQGCGESGFIGFRDA